MLVDTTQVSDDLNLITADSAVASFPPALVGASRQAILKSANQAVQDNYLWSFARDGKFSGAQCNKAWASFPGRIISTSTAYSYYFGKKDGDDKSSIHDMSQRAFPGVFDLSSVTSSNWRLAPVHEVLAFAQDLFHSPNPAWLGTTEVV